MAKAKGAKDGKPSAVKAKSGADEKAASKAGVSDALRQAVKDLGGDDGDLELIAGVDDDEEGDFVESKSGKSNEVS